MVPYLFRSFVALILVLTGFVAYKMWQEWPVEPRVQALKGTVERRIHLSIKGDWDTNKRHKFVCTEEP